MRLAASAAVLVVAGTVCMSCTSGSRSPAGVAPEPTVMATDSACTMTGPAPHPGDQLFRVDDAGSMVTEVDVRGGAADATVYGEIESVGPGTTAEMPVDVGPGMYELACEPGLQDAYVTSIFTVAGTGSAAAGVKPTSDGDYAGPIHAYLAFVARELAALRQGLGPLRAALTGGDRAGAEEQYAGVHAHYERIGAVYDAFGDLDTKINGVRPNWDASGFHELEQQLWTGAPLPAAATTVDGLDANVAALEGELPTLAVDPKGFAVRAHEILENALQEQVTGLVEPYSHTGMADAVASTAGATEVITVLRPLIQDRDPALLTAIDQGFARLAAVLVPLESTADDALTTAQREEVTGAMSGLLTDLAVIPGLIEPPPQVSDDQ